MFNPYSGREKNPYSGRRSSLMAGLSFGSINQIEPISFLNEFFAGSIVPARGTGSPTFTRATVAYVEDWEGLLKAVVSGEVRFKGLRRVRNLIAGAGDQVPSPSSVDFSRWALTAGTLTAEQTDPVGGTQATRITNTSAGTVELYTTNNTGVDQGAPGKQYRNSMWVRRISGTGAINLVNPDSTSYDITSVVTTSWQRVATDVQTHESGRPYIGIRVGTPGDVVDIAFPMSEEVTGQTNQNPSEYVSVGVLAAPYHGANVDGVKYFTTENGNTVASNVVTEATGAALTNSPRGYCCEVTKTNLLTYSADFTHANWGKNFSTATADQSTSPDGTTSMDLLKNSDGSGVQYHYAYQTVSLTENTTYTASFYVKYVAGSGIVWILGNTSGDVFCYFNIQTGVVTQSTGFVSANVQDCGNDIYRIEATFTNTATTGNQQVGIGVCETTAVPSFDSTGNADQEQIYIWGAQLEAATFASSYIVTTTTAVARNSDVLTCPMAGNASATAGTAYAELQTISTAYPSPTSAISFADSSGPLRWTGGMLSTDSAIWDGTTQLRKQGLTDMNTAVRKRASSWGAAGLSVTGDGATVATAAFDGSMGSTSLGIGNDPGGMSQFNGTIQCVKIWTVQLPDSELQRMTS